MTGAMTTGTMIMGATITAPIIGTIFAAKWNTKRGHAESAASNGA
jgi:hypothetical protein